MCWCRPPCHRWTAGAAGPIDRAIADDVARLIPDHATIEPIPQAVTNALGRKQGLGVPFRGDRRRDRRCDGGRYRRQPAQGMISIASRRTLKSPSLKSSLASLCCDDNKLYHVNADLSICGAPPSGFAAVLSHVEHKPLLIFSRTCGGRTVTWLTRGREKARGTARV
jgi:hypothetical protein